MKKGLGLSAKFSIFTVILIFVTVLCITLYQVRRESIRGGEDLVQRGRALAEMVAQNCEYGLYVEDRDALQQLVESAFAEESVSYVVILNQAKTPLAAKTRNTAITIPDLPTGWKDSDDSSGSMQLALESNGADFIEINLPVFGRARQDPLNLSLDGGMESAGPQRLGLVRLGLTRQILEDRLRESFFSALTFTLLLVLAGTLLTLFGVRKMTAPLKAMTRVTEQIAEGEGDLTRTFEISSKDEIGALAQGFNRFVHRLREMVHRTREGTSDIVAATGRIQHSSHGVSNGVARQTEALSVSFTALQQIDSAAAEVAKSTNSLVVSAEESSSATLELGSTVEEIAGQVGRLFSIIDEVSTSITQLAATGQNIFSNVETLSATMELTASAVTQMDAAIREVKENAEKTDALSEKASHDAEVGMSVVKASIEGINAAREMVDTAGNAILDLGRKSNEIGKILTVMNDVADQTSLLSLNAAIIAAQAGEHGKGFAVVADEIRELAERSVASTREIAEIIASIQAGTETAVKAMKAGRDRVHEEVARSRQAQQALEQIRESSVNAAEQVRNIMRSTHEQSQGSQRITESINQVASMLEQIFTSVSEQDTGNKYLSRSAESMRDIALLVRQSIMEQAKGSRQINVHMENVRSMIKQINSATHSQTARSREVLELFSELRKIAEENAQRTRELDEVVETLTRQTAVLDEGMGAFRV